MRSHSCQPALAARVQRYLTVFSDDRLRTVPAFVWISAKLILDLCGPNERRRLIFLSVHPTAGCPERPRGKRRRLKRKLGASPPSVKRIRLRHERNGRAGLLLVRPNPPAMLEDRQPSMVRSASRAASARDKRSTTTVDDREAGQFLPFQRHSNAMVRCPHTHHNLHICGYHQLGRNRATCRLLVEIKSAARHPIAVRWLPSPPLGALTYPVRSDAVQRNPNAVEFECEKTGHPQRISRITRSMPIRRSAGRFEDSWWTALSLILDGRSPSRSRVTGILYTSAIWVGGLQILLVPVGDCRRICIEGSAASTIK